MVTVIPTNEELTTPVNNGVTGADSSDNERLFQLIKDYQEVDFHRSPSCKPLPEDILSKTLVRFQSPMTVSTTFYLDQRHIFCANRFNRAIF
jgi:hypothetical protein